MKSIKVFYAQINNMGDLLNELIIKEMFGYQVICANRYTCDLAGIGSGLNMFFPEKSELAPLPKYLLQRMYCSFHPKLEIWTTGFINYQKSTENICMRKINNVAAVRGNLTKRRLEKILERPLDIPTGDGGLLASYLIKSKIEKKYSIGIIPHFREKDEPIFLKLKDKYTHSIIIDLTKEPMAVIKKIAECEVILSSSLHGLIVSDSFHIPNKRIVYSSKPLGDGFKYDDYYSAFNLSVEPYNLLKNHYPTINEIIDDYKVNNEIVEKKKKQLIESFYNII